MRVQAAFLLALVATTSTLNGDPSSEESAENDITERSFDPAATGKGTSRTLRTQRRDDERTDCSLGFTRGRSGGMVVHGNRERH